MTLSPAGKIQLTAHLFIFAVNFVVLGLSAQVNIFQEFFFVADLFPLVLSIITLVVLFTLFTLDFALHNPFSGRPQFLISLFGILTIFWLALNAFSTSRWRFVPLTCGSIPDDFADERQWCKDLQALKVFVWIEWVGFLLTTVLTLRYTLTQYARGNKHIFEVSLSHYYPRQAARIGGYDATNNFGRDSEFLQYEKM